MVLAKFEELVPVRSVRIPRHYEAKSSLGYVCFCEFMWLEGRTKGSLGGDQILGQLLQKIRSSKTLLINIR